MLGVLESIHAFLEANKVAADVGLCHLSGLQMGCSLCPHMADEDLLTPL